MIFVSKKISLNLRQVERNFLICFVQADNKYIFKDLPTNLRYDVIWEQNSDTIYFIAEGRMNFKSDFIGIKQINQKNSLSLKVQLEDHILEKLKFFQILKEKQQPNVNHNEKIYYLSLTSFENELFNNFRHIINKMKKIALKRRQIILKQYNHYNKDDANSTKQQLKRTQPSKNTVLLREYIKQNSKKTLEDLKPNDYENDML